MLITVRSASCFARPHSWQDPYRLEQQADWDHQARKWAGSTSWSMASRSVRAYTLETAWTSRFYLPFLHFYHCMPTEKNYNTISVSLAVATSFPKTGMRGLFCDLTLIFSCSLDTIPLHTYTSSLCTAVTERYGSFQFVWAHETTKKYSSTILATPKGLMPIPNRHNSHATDRTFSQI